MKILNYFLVKYIHRLHINKSIDNKENALWGAIVLIDSYLILFLINPLIDLIFGLGVFGSITNREKAIILTIPLIIFNLFYFFWDTRWLKLYEEVKEWPKEKIIKQRNILIGLLLILTILSIIYQYYNFSFGRW